MDLWTKHQLESFQLMYYVTQFEQLYALDNNIRIQKEDLVQNAKSG